MGFIGPDGEPKPIGLVFLSEDEIIDIQTSLLRTQVSDVEYSRKLGALVGRLEEPRRFLARADGVEETW